MTTNAQSQSADSKLLIQSDDLTDLMAKLESLTDRFSEGEDRPAIHRIAPLKIDWNRLQPDGTPAALTALLQWIAESFNASVFLGQLGRGGHAASVHCNDPAWTVLKRKPLWLRNALVEAAHSSFLISSSQAIGTLTAVMVQANREFESCAVVGLRLTLDPGQPKFGFVLARRESLSLEQAEQLASECPQLSSQLENWLRCWHQNAFARQWKSRFQRFAKLFRIEPKRITLAILGMFLLLGLPTPYWPKRACVLEPMVRKYVSSPMDGRVLESFVKPGETVSVDQLLARLDDEELKWSLDSAKADYEATASKRDIGLASRSSGNMRVAQLELKQIEVRIESIQANLERLSVRSPIDGVVLQGDWYRSQGAPVSRGDTLFEVAPLDRMTVETHLTTDDLAQIQTGDLATLRVDSSPGKTWAGKLERIDPRGKIIDDKVVFVAEFAIDGDSQLKPGMKGTVTLSCQPRSLAWLLFNRPYRWLVKKLPW